MNRPLRFATIVLTLTTSAVAACSKPAPPPPPAPATPNADSIARAREAQVRADSIARADAMRRANEQRRADSISAARTAAEAAARDAESMRQTLATAVYFDFDKSELRGDTRETLDAKLPILMANTGVAIRVAGHTDDRGSGEYNLQLGQRRAASVRDYLVARGVASARIELVSYGEERPVCQDKTESCWSRNRRAEFEITAGGSMLRKP